MAIGYKTGGRRKGTPNKRTNELAGIVRRKYKNFNPIIELIKLFNDEETDISTKVYILKEITPYLFPKRKAVDSVIEQQIQKLSVKYPAGDLFARIHEKAKVFERIEQQGNDEGDIS